MTHALNADHQTRSVMLTISGCPVRYYLGAAPPAATIPGTPDAYADVGALVSCSSWSERVPIKGGIAEIDALSLTLATAGELAEATDAARVLGRLGPQGADWLGQIAEALPADAAATTITLREAPPAWLAGATIHVGAEAILVGGIAGLTLTACTRGVSRTGIHAHAVAASVGDYPQATYPLTSWRGRLAWLSMASGPSWREVMVGMIESTPEIEGNTVALRLVPLTAILDESFPAAGEEVGLLQDYHYFQAGKACVWEHAQVCHAATLQLASSTAFVLGNQVNAPDARANGSLAGWTDITLPSGHPRAPRIMGSRSAARIDAVTSYGAGAYVLAVPVKGTYTPGGGDGIEWPGGTELIRADVTAGSAIDSLQPWPEALEQAIAASAGSSTHTGAGGTWVRLNLNRAGPTLLAWPNIRARTDGGPETPLTRPCEVRPRWAATGRLAGADNEPYDWATGAPRRSPRDSRLWLPVRPAEGADALFAVNRWTAAPTVYGVELATAWYQPGEGCLLVSPCADGSAPVMLDTVRGWAEVKVSQGEVAAWVTVTAVTPVLDGGSTVGYLLTIAPGDVDQLPALADWPSGDRVKVRQVAAVIGGWRSTLRQVLLSPGSSGQLPVGLALPASLLANGGDSGSFPTGRMMLPDETSVADLVEGFLVATSQALVVTRRGGAAKLGLVRVGLEETAAVVGAVIEARCSADAEPLNGIDDELINRVEIRVDWSEDGEESKRSITINNMDSQRRHREVKSTSLDLRGVRLEDEADATAEWLWLAARIGRTYGDPRRRWTVRVPVGDALALSLGDTVSVTHRLLRGYGPALGVVNAGAVVTGITIDPCGAEGELTLTHHGTITTGWAASLRVAEILSPTQVRVETAYYSLADLDWWAAGDVARCTPAGNRDAASVNTIASILGAAVTFLLPHGLAVGDTVEQRAAPPDSAAQARLARLDYGQIIG